MAKESMADKRALLEKITQTRMRISLLDHERQIAVIELRAYEEAAKLVFGEDFFQMGSVFGLNSEQLTLSDFLKTYSDNKPGPSGVVPPAAPSGVLPPSVAQDGPGLWMRFLNDAPKTKKRGLSGLWGKMLATLNTMPSFTYSDIQEAAKAIGTEVSPNVARSQMKLYADSGLVERIADGRFRITAEGMAAARSAITRTILAPAEAEAEYSPDDGELQQQSASSKPQPATHGEDGKEDV